MEACAISVSSKESQVCERDTSFIAEQDEQDRMILLLILERLSPGQGGISDTYRCFLEDLSLLLIVVPLFMRRIRGCYNPKSHKPTPVKARSSISASYKFCDDGNLSVSKADRQDFVSS